MVRATISERRSAQAKPSSSSARSRIPWVVEGSQCASTALDPLVGRGARPHPSDRRDSGAPPKVNLGRRNSYPPDSTDADSDPADATPGYPPDSTDDSNRLNQITF